MIMLDLNENDKKLWKSIWPWGFVWSLTVIVSMAASEYILRGNTAQFGKLFYAFLIVPFAWHGYDWYAKYLYYRLVNTLFIRMITILYLVMISYAMIFTLRELNYAIIFIITVQTIITVYVWLKQLEDLSEIIQTDVSSTNDFLGRYFYDVAMFVFPVVFVLMFD